MPKFACCTWALSGPEHETLGALAALGFQWIDIRAGDFTAPASRTRIQEVGLQLSCVGLSFALPADVTLDSLDGSVRTAAVAAASAGLAQAAALGATTAYVVPGYDRSAPALAAYGESLMTLAERGADAGIKIGIEHFPGRALPTIAATLAYVREIGHPNLYLLFDIGHAQLSGEDPVASIHAAGDRLGYVHLDDNDGQGDLHWALLDGLLTRATLRETLAALDEVGYSGGVSLELSPQLPDPRAAIQQSWTLLQTLNK
ncbi:MAG: sugar phosphate isomerase/epimerase [Caldilineaceae bacterium]